ncbi:hypothetical protein DP163_gp127 [Sea otter poxvirus]|uniref:Uncharacterized protein n=1 Tax=Sea otter poxvirus TaxID=1416741 RepID=A0A2U9QHW6_9POXV|nr:hypothetical protein DP163_gp127 [Sea otter poxvirus]AWU47172.1 hypothetical protein [Sea otter poxvirus]
MPQFKVVSYFPFAVFKKHLMINFTNGIPIPNHNYKSGKTGKQFEIYKDCSGLLCEISKHFLGGISSLINNIVYQRFYVGEGYQMDSVTNDMTSKVIICTRASAPENTLVIRSTTSCESATLELFAGMVIVLSNTAYYEVSTVSGGSVVLAILSVSVPELEGKHIIDTLNNVMYLTSPRIMKHKLNYITVSFRRLKDAVTKQVVCEQYCLDGQWYTILYITPNHKRCLSSLCIGTTSLEPVVGTKTYNEIHEKILQLIPPYNICTVKKCVYSNRYGLRVGNEEILYCMFKLDNGYVEKNQ